MLLDAHVAIGAESTYGTAVTTSRGVLCNPAEWQMAEDMQRIYSNVRTPGQFNQAAIFSKAFMGMTGGGPIDVLDKGYGIWLQQALGGFSSAVHPVEASMKRMTFTPDPTLKKGLMMSLQLFKPYMDTAGEAFTTLGAKVLGAKWSCDVGGNVKSSVTVDGRDVASSGDIMSASITTGTKLFTVTSTVGLSPGMALTGTGVGVASVIDYVASATTFYGTVNNTATNASAAVTYSRGTAIPKASPTYSTGAQPFGWVGNGITIDGIAVGVQGWEIAYDWTVKTDRRYMANGGLKDEPVVIELSKATLSLKGIEFLLARNEYNRYMAANSAQSVAAAVITCTTPAPAAEATKGQIQFTIPTAVSTSGVPDTKGMQPADFEIVGAPGLTVVYDTLDASP